ncbi:TniB family NTP-binding protein [Polaromonas naphthalenivorans]|uniref:TniB family protein n=1 Tax=Polaromonas naphthalenivorans (strain CJ2) TaxID=365044 RepID=A1VWS3_POLNA|nr:TniB family NTP-binding protein [Polaromonas naphthalenivorans]ABM40101.1 TniB family protein [Polaromonas naphthalenivorans CJ2]
MTPNLDHLHTGVWSFLEDSTEERVTRLYSPKWVAYARGNEALARMGHLLNHPPSGRMPCMLLHGDSNIGKNMIVEKFLRDNPNVCNDLNEVEVRRGVHLQMPAKPSDDKLYAQIVEGLGIQAPINRRGVDMELLGLRLLHRQPPKMMIIDEVHHLLAGTVREQRQLLNQLKFISNELRIPIVALGTNEALYAMQTDPQIASRFEPFALPKWRESNEFRAFVVSFGRLLPLEKPSPLADKDIIQKLMSLSAGLTGKVTTLLVQAAELAIRQKTECITLDLIEQAAASGIYKYLPVGLEAESF